MSFPAMIADFDRIKPGQPWFFNISTFLFTPGQQFRARLDYIAYMTCSRVFGPQIT
jgi:hypothetical protein